ncbi:cobaltochelatase CobT-related protein [Novosphingobium sp. NPDC080210]|uniref:cobaltochelatase CobT-related protein n=1 Tax=Novosphingobium sp. NPDC080210 TaxID=3390596 RepID=UPI003D021791
MLYNLSTLEAMDVVDAYGPDRSLWPQQYVAAMDRAIKRDQELADYIADTARIEAMLENWDEDEDGAQIDLSDLEGPDDEDEDDYDVSQHGGGFDNMGGATAHDDADDEDAPEILEVNMSDIEDIGDLDGNLTDLIRKEIELAGNEDDSWNVFTKDYDKILDVTPPPSTSIAEIDQAVQATTGPLQKELRRLIAAKTMSKRLPGLRRGKLHGANLHRILAGDDRVFFRRQEAPALDTAVSLLIDCSGSMTGSRLQLAVETAYALAAVFNRLGIAFECLGFTTANAAHPDYKEWSSKKYRQELDEASRTATIHRHQPIAIPGFKTFDERWTPDVQRRFAYSFNRRGMDIAGNDMGGTPESCSNEFAARRLLQRKEQRKIMITMTDGEPTANPYNSYDGLLARRRSAQVTKMIEAAGIDLIGIGIQHAGPKAYYSNAMVINDLSEMPTQLLALFKQLLLGK